jgi:predicted metal-dependent phosphoesterase TrpH
MSNLDINVYKLKERQMSNNKQSSVEWLLDRIEDVDSAKIWEEIKQQAKAMHKDEIERAHYDGSVIVISKPDDDMLQLSQQYYNETFGE